MNVFSKIAFTLAAVAGAAISSANTDILRPADRDLGDLDHYYAYSWGVNYNLAPNEVITGAKLKIKNIWDWTAENNDILNVTMLDNPALGIKTFYDNQGGGDFFAGQGTSVGSWSDPVGGVNNGFDLEFDLGELGLLDQLNQYAADGRLGFGFDPDCHYYNDGVSLELTTACVPEPASMSALALGGLAFFFRRKKSK